MGLDMYAFRVGKEVELDPSGIDLKLGEAFMKHYGMTGDVGHEASEKARADKLFEQISYWRRFNMLHGWMEGLYESKGGQETFNCCAILLTDKDIDQLEADTKARSLAPTQGFFFGGQEIEDGDWEEIESFIAKARGVIANGDRVIYDSWW